MSVTLQNYAHSIIAGDARKIAVNLSPDIKVRPPGSNQPHEGLDQTSTILSTASIVIQDFKFVRSYHTDSTRYAILFEGKVDGYQVQIIDHIHINEQNFIDQVDIFMRPASLGKVLYERVTSEAERRMLNQ